MEEMKISWFTKVILKLSPKRGMHLLARKMGIENPVFDQAHELFSKTSRIDIFPSASGSRGFQIILDQKTALYFYQDGDHFTYDGYEMGEYDPGDVTIFDRVNK